MKKLRRAVLFTLAVVLSLTLFFPVRAAETVYFTAINDSLMTLSSDTMPLWSGGTLYVPYTVFDGNNSTGVNLGISSGYSRSSGTVTLYNLQQMLTFDLNNGTSYNAITEEPLSGKAILRNGRPYVPVSLVCSFFGLSYSNISISQGVYLVRIKNGDVVLSDKVFVDAASQSIQQRLREYYQTNQSIPTPGVLPPTEEDTQQGTQSGDNQQQEGTQTEMPEDVVPVYLGFDCEEDQGLTQILDVLDSRGEKGIFFFRPQQLEEQEPVLYRILGSGHSVGLIADGRSLSATRQQLEQGQQALAMAGYTQTTLAMVPESQRSALEDEGWVCWEETLSAVPEEGVSAASYAQKITNRLKKNKTKVCLTLDGGTESAQVLSTLLRQLTSQSYWVDLPLETKL